MVHIKYLKIVNGYYELTKVKLAFVFVSNKVVKKCEFDIEVSLTNKQKYHI